MCLYTSTLPALVVKHDVKKHTLCPSVVGETINMGLYSPVQCPQPYQLIHSLTETTEEHSPVDKQLTKLVVAFVGSNGEGSVSG